MKTTNDLYGGWWSGHLWESTLLHRGRGYLVEESGHRATLLALLRLKHALV